MALSEIIILSLLAVFVATFKKTRLSLVFFDYQYFFKELLKTLITYDNIEREVIYGKL